VQFHLGNGIAIGDAGTGMTDRRLLLLLLLAPASVASSE